MAVSGPEADTLKDELRSSIALDVLDEVAASALLVAGFGHWRAEQTADIR